MSPLFYLVPLVMLAAFVVLVALRRRGPPNSIIFVQQEFALAHRIPFWRYPDLVAAGGLGSALQRALVKIGSDLRARELDKAIKARSVNMFVHAKVESGSRFSQVYVAAAARLFLFDFWSRGVMLAQGRTPKLVDMARAINRWVGSSCTTAELASEFGFVIVDPCAGVYERGEEVDHRWQEYLSSLAKRSPELTAFVVAASHRRELRQLFPFTSLNTFHFSRCTGYPFTADTPYVRPLRSGEYEVVDPAGRPLGQGNAEVAADLVVRHLPVGCGRAVPGTAHQLAGG